MTFEGVQLQGAVKIMEKLNVGIIYLIRKKNGNNILKEVIKPLTICFIFIKYTIYTFRYKSFLML